MNTLDQVLLLEQKVESAVEKIQQLQAENDALRSKCDELTNALSAKSEQLSSFETDSSRIETGIQKALDRLNSIEDSILKSEGQVQIPSTKSEVKSESKPETKSQTISNQNESYSHPTVQVVQDFNSMDNLEETSEDDNQNDNQSEESTSMDDSTDEPMEEPFAEEDNPQDEDLGFDIF